MNRRDFFNQVAGVVGMLAVGALVTETDTTDRFANYGPSPLKGLLPAALADIDTKAIADRIFKYATEPTYSWSYDLRRDDGSYIHVETRTKPSWDGGCTTTYSPGQDGRLHAPISELSEREKQIIGLMSDGLPDHKNYLYGSGNNHQPTFLPLTEADLPT